MQGTASRNFVAIANMAADLHSVLDIARGVSLAAKNAKIISSQAGDVARGFQPITNFIDEISVNAMDGVNDIDREALALTQVTVNEQRARDAQCRFASVLDKHADAPHINSLAGGMARVDRSLAEAGDNFIRHIRMLKKHLQNMDQCMLSARSIASVSKIVSANTGDYKDKLQTVSRSLDQAATLIKEKIDTSHRLLSDLQV